jgi:diadenosine tetraphosphate (Ap4A) HIT family hydrolase/GNAT superfamily N-acetyltransferase
VEVEAVRQIVTSDGRSIEVECLSCAVTAGLVESSGGTIAETKYFHAHQDIAYPVPGLVIIASKRHFYGLDEMDDNEASEYIQFLRRIREAQRKRLGIEHVYYFYNEDTTHHFHIWMVPRHDWMDAFGRSVESVRPVLLHARNEMATEDNLEKVRIATELLRRGLSESGDEGKGDRLVRLNPVDIEEDAKAILSAAIFEPTKERIDALLSQVYSVPETTLFGLVHESTIVSVAGIRRVTNSIPELIHIAVKPSERHKGFGRQIIRMMITEGTTSLYAETDLDAVGFYKHCGFSIDSLGQRYLGIERFACTLKLGGMRDNE